MVKTFLGLVKTLRPKHWIKNVVVFAALVFSTSFFDLSKDLIALGTFFMFCLAAGSVYIINDIADREEDRKHPVKSKRPIASGELGIRVAGLSALVLFLGSAVAGFFIHLHVGLIILMYLFANLAYSFWLEEVVIMDVLVISFGFVLRAIAGAIAIDVNISPWLVISTMFLALFLALNKRKAEVSEADKAGGDSGGEAFLYTLPYLNQLIMIVTTATIVSYALYSFNSVHSDQILWTIPFVLYGAFRYMYLIEVKGYEGQLSEVLIKDKPLVVDILLWGIAVVMIMIFFNSG